MQASQIYNQPQFQRFNSLTTLEQLSQNYQIPPQYRHHKDINCRPTEQSDVPSPIQLYQARSNKKITQDLGISFQENFMEQHSESLINQLQNYVEQQDKLAGINPLSSQAKGILKPCDTVIAEQACQASMTQIFESFSKLLSTQQRQQLIIDLKRQDKLQEFLLLILKNIKDEVGSQVLFIVNEVFEEYLHKQDFELTQDQLLEFSENSAEKLFQKLDSKLLILNYKVIPACKQEENTKGRQPTPTAKHQSDFACDKERIKNFKKFITFLTTTLMLVISGHFQNPYFKMTQNYYKRQCSEQESNLRNNNLLLSDNENNDRYEVDHDCVDEENEDGDDDDQLPDIFGSKKMKF